MRRCSATSAGASSPTAVARPARRARSRGGNHRPRRARAQAREPEEARGVNRLGRETSPYLLQHADNPVDWYPVGRGGLRARPERGQADPPLDRLLGLPLVPRDGARVVRGRGDGGADERALRQRQGRPRGAARPRRGLHGRRRRADRAGRLADDGVPDARRRAVLRRHVLPARAAARAAGLPAGAARRSRTPGASGATTSATQAGALVEALGARRASREPSAEPLVADAPGRGRRGAAPRLRPRVRRLRRRAEVPARLGARVPAAPRRAATLATRTLDAMAARRHVRPARRRLPPLLGRPSAGSCRTSRRCSTTTRCSRPRTCTAGSRDRRGALPRGRRGDARLHAARARARRRRLRLGAGRRHRRRGGADVHVDGGARASPPELLEPFEHGRFDPPRRARRRDEGAALRAARAAAEAGARRQGDRLVERARARRARRGGRGGSSGATGSTRPWASASSCSGRSRLPTAASTAPGATGRAKGTGYLEDYADVAHGLLELHVATGELRWLEEAHRLALLAVELFGDDERGGFFLTPVDGERLVARKKGFDDNPTPRGNSMLAYVLLRLARHLRRRRARAAGGLGAPARRRARARARRPRSAGRSSRSTSTSRRRASSRDRPARLARSRAGARRAGTRTRSSRSARRRACRCSRGRSSSTGSPPSTSASASPARRR